MSTPAPALTPDPDLSEYGRDTPDSSIKVKNTLYSVNPISDGIKNWAWVMGGGGFDCARCFYNSEFY